MAHTATPDERKIKSQFDSLSKEAFFDVLLPKSADFDAAEALRNGAPEDLHRAPARRNLFFGSITAIIDAQAITNILLGLQTRKLPSLSS